MLQSPIKKGPRTKFKNKLRANLPLIQMQPMMISHPRQFVRTSGKRPVDKIMISVSKAAVDSTQVSTVLLLVTFPCTIVGIRWSGTVNQDAGTGTAQYNWAIVVLRQGVTVSTMASGDGNTFFTPETNCLVFANGAIDNNVEAARFDGSTKTMRKMQGGDQLLFLSRGSATNTSSFNFTVQFFCKT